MRRTDFSFQLPPELIASKPALQRSKSRLLVVDRARQNFTDAVFEDLPDLLNSGDLLVFNDTRVIKARLLGHKQSGGKAEILIERVLDEHHAQAQIRASRSPKAGSSLDVAGQTIQVLGREGDLFQLGLTQGCSWLRFLETNGQVPLPPYIERNPEADDSERYQTIYAKQPGAVAAPTAGLHFDHELVRRLDAKGLPQAYVTLHVGLGTFQPMRVESVAEHQMHSERISVPTQTCQRIEQARAHGNRVVAVGTTTLRSLESAYQDGRVQPMEGETDIFIYPGKSIHSIDALVTNFHLPESTLLMLVCALAGTDLMLNAYAHAVREKYRFFSYGDAMLIL